MKIAIIGATGNVGTRLTDEALRRATTFWRSRGTHRRCHSARASPRTMSM